MNTDDNLNLLELENIKKMKINIVKHIENRHQEWITAICISENRLYISSYEGRISCYELQNFCYITNFMNKELVKTMVTYDKLLIVGGFKSISFYDEDNSFDLLQEIDNYHQSRINKLYIINDMHLLSCSDDKCINIYNLISNKKVTTISNYNEEAYSLYCLNNYLVVGGNKHINIYNISSKFSLYKRLLNIHNKKITAIIDNKFNEVITGSEDKGINIIDKNKFEIKDNVSIKVNIGIRSLASINNNLFICGNSNNILIYQRINGKYLPYNNISNIHNDWINCLIIYKNYLISGSDDATVKINQIKYEENYKFDGIINKIKENTTQINNNIAINKSYEERIIALENKYEKLTNKYKKLKQKMDNNLVKDNDINVKLNTIKKNNLIDTDTITLDKSYIIRKIKDEVNNYMSKIKSNILQTIPRYTLNYIDHQKVDIEDSNYAIKISDSMSNLIYITNKIQHHLINIDKSLIHLNNIFLELINIKT